MAVDAPQAVGRPSPPDFDFDPVQAKQPAAALAKGAFWGNDGFSFGDLVDLINPLQHIPIISNIYRSVTGDQIAAGPRMLGGGLFGGPIGLAASMANMAVEEATGKDVGGHILAAVGFDSQQPEAPPPAVNVADAGPLSRGAASGNEVAALPPPRPAATSFFETPRVNALAAARNNLFSISLPVPAGAAGPAGSLPGAASDDDKADAFNQGLRAEDLSAKDLAKILALYQQAKPGEPVQLRPPASAVAPLTPLSSDSSLEK